MTRILPCRGRGASLAGIHPATRMLPALRFLPCLLAAAVALATLSAGDVEKTPAPAWVTAIPLETGRPYDSDASSNDIRYHLIEYQSTVDEAATHYRRVAYEITTRDALDDHSSLSFPYAPGAQALALHHLRVIRNGEVSDRLADQEIQLLQREGSLESNLYDGRVSAHLLLEDIRVGDVIDYAISVRGGNPTLGGRYFQNRPLEFTRPVGRMFVRHVSPPGRPFQYRAHLTDLEPEIRETESGRELIWDQYDVPGTRHESSTPMWHFVYPTLEMGEFSEWSEVVEWALPLYDLGQPLPEELVEKATALRELPPEERITEALRFVQSELRYVAMALGPHSYQPYPLRQVWSRKFGDCKDKTLLLVALLRAAGIDDAWPALVETDFGQVLPRTLPSPLAFDHVLVHVLHDGVDYWLEATASRQEGPLDRIYKRNLGHALVIRPGETGLTEMRPQAYDHTRTEVDEHFKVAEYGAPVSLAVETRYFGAEADRVRANFQRDALVDTAENYVAFYRKTYSGLRQVAPPATEDDPLANIFTVRESYEIDDFFAPQDGGSDYQCILSAAIVDEARTVTGTLDRTTPHELYHPHNLVQTLRLTLPGPATFDDDDTLIEHPSAIYQQRLRHEGNTLVIRHEYRTLRDHIAPGDLAAFRKMTNEIYQITDYPVSVPSRFFGVEGESESLGESATHDSTWLAILFGVLGMAALVSGIVVAGVLIFVPIGIRKPLPPTDYTAPIGIAGWLVLLAIGVVLTPVACVFEFIMTVGEFDRELMATLTDFENTPHAGWWIAAVATEFAFALFIIPVTVASVVLFFQKRRIFPALHIAVMISSVVIFIFIVMIMHTLDASTVESDTVVNLVRGIIHAIIWTLYLLLSRRVSNTFFTFPGRRKPASPPPPPLPGPPLVTVA